MESTQKSSNQRIESNHPNLTITNGPSILCNITNPQAQINTVTPSINSNTTHEDNQVSNPPFPTIQVVCGVIYGQSRIEGEYGGEINFDAREDFAVRNIVLAI